MVDHVVVVQVITASRPEWIAPFTGLEPDQFRKPVRLVTKRGGDEIADGRLRDRPVWPRHGRRGLPARLQLHDHFDVRA
jgi:hypothetical protein